MKMKAILVHPLLCARNLRLAQFLKSRAASGARGSQPSVQELDEGGEGVGHFTCTRTKTRTSQGRGQGIDHITFIDLFRTHEGFLPSDS